MSSGIFVKTISAVPALAPVAKLAEQGAIKVEVRGMDEKKKALYVPTEGAHSDDKSLADTVLLSDRIDWSQDSIMNRSILVHEAYHAKDDIDFAGQQMLFRDTEARAWTGQAAYLIKEIQTSDDPDSARKSVLAEFKKMGELPQLAMALAVANVKLPTSLKPGAESLEKALTESVVNMTGWESMFSKPEEGLKGTLDLIYTPLMNPSLVTITADGIKPKS